MGLFDKLKNNPVAPQDFQAGANSTQKIVFTALPETFEQFCSLPQAKMETPFDTAAMTVLAFCFYPDNKDLSLRMLDFLKGPQPLSPMDKQFIRDRFMDKDYVRSGSMVVTGSYDNFLFNNVTRVARPKNTSSGSSTHTSSSGRTHGGGGKKF